MLFVGAEKQSSHGSPRRWLWGGEAEVLMAFPDTVCVEGRRGEFLKAVSGPGHGRDRVGGSHLSPKCWLSSLEAGFSWQSQMLVVGAGKEWHSWQSQTLFVQWGEARVLMAFPDAGCGGQRRGFSWQSQTLDVCWEAVTEAGCGWKEEGFSWQSQTLVVG